ncbi:glycoside hydrolase domain-containing protein [Acidovorax sp. SUPP3334]|uniref:glycoside hydrolase domain-containing protein n=1 Tax=Acidovorax sp. SUPP3334 TaxID=2920881 RepID=UPI0023DE2470|nr:glycoside hydrolase domain-containing protein [Acidovorax sp. SUPP3334]GKT26506.1 DUF1906 domain-containing protein [Acidovorax sp. SUPP3334]
MDNYTGFDTANFPGMKCMEWLKSNTGLTWCGFYLAPAPSHQNTSWMNQRKALSKQGWGLAPIYVGRQTCGPGAQNPTGSQGSTDGAQSAHLAGVAGFAPQSTLYLDWEDGSPPGAEAMAYINHWIAAVIAAGYQPGLYCSHVVAPTMKKSVSTTNPAATLRMWVWKVTTAARHRYDGDIRKLQPADPAGSGTDADLWQFEQNAVLTLPDTHCDGLQLDLSWSTLQDPHSPAPQNGKA